MISENLNRAIESIIDGTSILISGSGASWGAKNINGEKFPSGFGLANCLYKECSLPEGNDLKDAADTYIERHTESKLIQKIRELLTVSTVENWHSVVYSQNWRTIYTTNYDDIPSISAKKFKQEIEIITLDMDFKDKISIEHKCIYINGYIGNLREGTLHSQFKLTSSSYQSAENIVNSPWGRLLADDIDSSRYIFVVGLSLEYDLDLERALKFSSGTHDKIIIITNSFDESSATKAEKEEHDKKIRKLKRFGEVYEIGIEGFSDAILTKSKTYTARVNDVTVHNYTCFEHSYNKPIIATEPASSSSVFGYYTYGKFDNNLTFRDRNGYSDIIIRKEINELLSFIQKNKKIIFLHSYFGNGKTGIVDALKVKLSKENTHIYHFIKYYPSMIVDDIDAISATEGKKIVIFEDAPTIIHVLKKISVTPISDMTLILTARTGLIESVAPEVCAIFNIVNNESVTIDVNKLNHNEIVQCDKIFSRYGYWGAHSGKKEKDRLKLLKQYSSGNSSLQSILMIAFESDVISKKISEIIEKIRNHSENFFEVLILAMVSRIMNLNLSVRDINEIIDVDTMRDTNFFTNDAVKELIELKGSGLSFKLHSSVIANKVLQSSTTASTIASVLYKTASFCIRYNDNLRYNNVLRYIISFSLITTFTNKFSQKENFILKYYDDLSRLDYFSQNHFFWLQYSMACIDIACTSRNAEYYKRAQQYIDTAYSLSETLNGFVPFQINNQQAKLLLRKIQNGFSENIESDMLRAHELLKLPITSRQDNPISVIKLFKYYVEKSFVEKFNTTALKLILINSSKEGYNIISGLCKNLSSIEQAQFDSLKSRLYKNSLV